MALNMVKIALENGSYISMPSSVVLSAGAPGSFVFGQVEFRATITLIDPTPAEALAVSPPQRKEAKAHRSKIQKQKAVGLPTNQKVHENLKKVEVERKSISSQLTYERKAVDKKAAVLVTEAPRKVRFIASAYKSEAGTSGARLSRRQNCSRNHKLLKSVRVNAETLVLAKNPFFPLAEMGEEGSSMPTGMVSQVCPSLPSPARGEKRKQMSKCRKQPSPGKQLQDTLRKVQRQGMSVRSQEMAKLAIQTFEKQQQYGWRQYKPTPKHVGAMSRQKVQQQEVAPRPLLHSTVHRIHSSNVRDGDKKEWIRSLGQSLYENKIPKEKSTMERKNELWVPRAPLVIQKHEGKAPPKKEALPEGKGKAIIPHEYERIEDLSEEDLRQWLLSSPDDMESDDGRPVSVYMVDTRSTSMTRKQAESPREEGATSTQGDMNQKMKEKDDQINVLASKLDEALKAIALLTRQAAQSNPSIAENVEATSGEAQQEQQPVDSQSPIPEVNSDVNGVNSSSVPEPPSVTQAVMEAMAVRAVSAALEANRASTEVKRGRPYPQEYEAVPYPAGFSQPRFRLFDGTGNPRQHTAQYRASCGFLGGSQPLLLKLFITSLTGIAFTWYSELSNDSVTTFDELEDLFVARFASAQKRVNIGNLVSERKRPDEDFPTYIMRWRNIAMQCEPQLSEKHSVELILENINGPMAPFLRGFEIDTFQVLLDKVTRMSSAMPKATSKEGHGKEKHGKPYNSYNHEAMVAQVVRNKKGKKITAVVAPLKGESKSKKAGLRERQNKEYSFKRESTQKLFNLMIEETDMELPEPKFPHEVDLINNPQFCPYHRCLGHTIEECYVFKDILEKKYQAGDVEISEKDLSPKASICIIGHSSVGSSSASKTSICMVHHKSESDPGGSSFQNKHGSEGGQDQILWQLLQQKDEEIAGLKAHIEELKGLMYELSDNNVKLKDKIKEYEKPHKSFSQKARIAQVAGPSGKEVATAVALPKLTEKKGSKLYDKLNKEYSFTRESTKKIFPLMMKLNLLLPEPKRPSEVGLVDEPLYCPFHRCLGHAIEDCYVFKDIVERKYQAGEIALSKKYLLPKATDDALELKGKQYGQLVVALAGSIEAHQDTLCLDSLESSSEKHNLRELSSMVKNSTLLEKVFSSKLLIGNEDGDASSSQKPAKHDDI